MITVAICDDNDFQREMMLDILHEYSVSHAELSASVFSSGRELLECVKSGKKFNIYILDVIMPEINGMEIATTLRIMKDDGKIIFTTATLEYAVASYDVQAYYYMVKPVDPQKLFRILDNAVAKLTPHENSVIVKTKEGEINLRIKDITFVEVEDRSLLFHLSDGRTCKSQALRNSFREAVDDLADDEGFAICGASKIINLKYIDAIDSDMVLLRDGTTIYPPRSAYAELRKKWREYHG